MEGNDPYGDRFVPRKDGGGVLDSCPVCPRPPFGPEDPRLE